jgi:hypothetical protein
MWKKVILGILIIEILIAWPLSLIKKPAKISLKTIFYPATQDEQWTFQKELALDTSPIKKFYLNKTTIVKERYLKNFLVLTDLNNYFFIMHPREDISGIDYRFKYPCWAIIFLIPAIGVTIKKKKYGKIWLIMFAEMLVLSFLKQMDGWDIILFLPITYLLYLGAREIGKYKYSWILFLGLITLMAIEIGRMFL